MLLIFLYVFFKKKKTNISLKKKKKKIHCENEIEFNVSLGSEYIFDYSLLLIDAFTLNVSRIFLI